jgi:hypothetical protein
MPELSISKLYFDKADQISKKIEGEKKWKKH